MKRPFTLLIFLLGFTAMMAQGGVAYNGGYTVTNVAVTTPAEMDPYSFDLALNTIRNRTFESTKMDLAMSVIQQNCLSTRQISCLMNLFCFESSKRDIARAAWFKVTDPANYFLIFDAFTFESSVRDLNAFMMANPRPAPVVPVATCGGCGMAPTACTCTGAVIPSCGTPPPAPTCGSTTISTTTTYSGGVSSSGGFTYSGGATGGHHGHGHGHSGHGGHGHAGPGQGSMHGGQGGMHGQGLPRGQGGFDRSGNPRPIYNKKQPASSQPLKAKPATTKPDPRKSGKVFSQGVIARR